MEILGILNITDDSFSDGGENLQPQQARQKAKSLVQQGAKIIDIGAQASNLAAKQISIEQEWARLLPIIQYLKQEQIAISVDTNKPEIIEKCLAFGVSFINDITGFHNPKSIEILQSAGEPIPQLIIMHSHNHSQKAESGSQLTTKNIVSRMYQFFDNQIEGLLKANIAESKIIVDPGMGFFLGEDPNLSILGLQEISALKEKYGRVLVSVSRKSFIGKMLDERPVSEREVGTLACEYFAYRTGVDYIRTHEPRAIQDMIRVSNILHNKIHTPT